MSDKTVKKQVEIDIKHFNEAGDTPVEKSNNKEYVIIESKVEGIKPDKSSDRISVNSGSGKRLGSSHNIRPLNKSVLRKPGGGRRDRTSLLSINKENINQVKKFSKDLKEITDRLKEHKTVIVETQRQVKKLRNYINNNKDTMKNIEVNLEEFKVNMDTKIKEILSKPIKVSDNIKSQLMTEIQKIHSSTKDEMTQKLKRIIICETSVNRINRDVKMLLSRVGQSNDLFDLYKRKKRDEVSTRRHRFDISEIK